MRSNGKNSKESLPLPFKNLKDTVFCNLFSNIGYLLQLYRELHPEDTDVSTQDIGNVTLRNVLMRNLYNDLAFTVRDKLVIMLESQSTWTVNITIRLLVYYAETIKRYILNTDQNSYGSRKLRIPEPEFYVLFTGSRKVHPEYISLAQEFFKSINLDLKVKVLYGDGDTDILSQYTTFTKVLDEKIKEMGRSSEAVKQTIHICKNRNILKEYLSNHEKEVLGIMDLLFDEEINSRILLKEEREEGRVEGAQEMLKKTVLQCHTKGFSANAIADLFDLTPEMVNNIITNA